ncbi:tRNA (guanine-N(7)-)-methyltransferase [Acidipropionibacterium jensenii]|uniref:tRNA (guanine-N(7)-)-methyltransferase n=1 Tax=Acidipropionibacterium jensenii TaxID=1749 RepID=A0A448P1I8_9ACTN|nr:tRNA (guanine-N(7)-)-methyltransferase [Acidipropionibacterium jensenii]
MEGPGPDGLPSATVTDQPTPSHRPGPADATPGPAADRSAGAHRSGDRFRRGVVSFVRRSPRMNTSQEHAMARLSDRYLVEVPHDTTTTSVAPGSHLDLTAIFGRRAPLTVEIGSGSGDVLASVAPAHPDRDFIGFEVYLPSVASSLTNLERAGADNVRIIVADAAAGLEHLIGPSELDELWTFFADPWHKKRHHKRRIVNPDMARLAASRLRPGAVWRLATDWDDYAWWMLDVLAAEPGLEPVDAGLDGFSPRWSERPITRYERKGRTAGRAVRDLTWRSLGASAQDSRQTPGEAVHR